MFTQSQIRTALLRTAERFERRPSSYDFQRGYIPEDEGGCPCCVLAWVGHDLGLPATKPAEWGKDYNDENPYHGTVGEILCGRGAQHEFYDRLNELRSEIRLDDEDGLPTYAWTRDARVAAEAIRLYADRYHPLEKAIQEAIEEVAFAVAA